MKSHVSEIVISAVIATIASYFVLVLISCFIYIDETILAAIMVIVVATTIGALLRSFAEEDKKEILEEIRKSRGE